MAGEGVLTAIDLRDLETADRDAVLRCQRGDAAAFDELYERNRARLLRYCRYRLGDSHEAEDVVQEAFARAWRNLPAFAGERRFYPWLRVVAANLCTDVQRRSARSSPEADVDPGTVDDHQEALVGRVERELVSEALGRLSDRYRSALQLREWDELSYEEIAERSGVTVGTVESLLWRARQALKRELSGVAGSDGLLAGLPVLGWLVRRTHGAGARLTQWAPRLRSGFDLGGTGTMAAVVVGAATVAGAVLPGPGPIGVPPSPALRPVWSAPSGRAGPTLLVPTPPSIRTGTPAVPAVPAGGGATGVGSTASTAPASSSGHTHLVNPVQVSSAAPARREAATDPVTTGSGLVSAGVDPGTAVHYVTATTHIDSALPGGGLP